MDKTLPETAALGAFARIAGYKPSYITQLKRDGRLVLTDDGKAVQVAASLARIAETRDPSKAGVADRHASARAAAQAGPAPAAEPEAASTAPKMPDPGMDKVGNSYQAARAVRERYEALRAKLSYEQSIGKVLEAAHVEAAAADAITTLRARLETLPDILAAQLAAEPDEARCRAVVAEAVEHALGELSRQFQRISQPRTPA